MFHPLKELIDLGFGPYIAIFILAIVALWVRLEWSQKKQNKTREEWHGETLKRVAEMQGHIEACDEDREQLMMRTATLEEQTKRLSSCPRKACPMRLPP